MKKPAPPKSVEEIREYIKAKNLCVDPDFFWEYFAEADWHDSKGNPVLSWKQKLLTWHREQIKKARPPKCTEPNCRRYGVYVDGYDYDGHPYLKCVIHKPKFTPVLPAELTNNVLKTVPKDNRDFYQKKNDAIEKLVLNEMERKK